MVGKTVTFREPPATQTELTMAPRARRSAMNTSKTCCLAIVTLIANYAAYGQQDFSTVEIKPIHVADNIYIPGMVRSARRRS
jgi:hypothetical protein